MVTLNNVLHAGMRNDLPEFLRRKVFPTNLIALILMWGIAFPFTIISIFYFDFLTFYPACGFLVCMGIIGANFIGGLYYTRFILSLVPILLGAVYNAYLSNDGEQPLPPLYLIELSFTMIPFVIFDLRERMALVMLSVFCGLVIVTFPLTNNWFISDIDSTVLRTGWLSSLTIVLAIACCIGCILGLALLNKDAESEAKDLLEASTQKNLQLEEAALRQQQQMKEIEEKNMRESRHVWSTNGLAMIAEIARTSEDNLYERLTSKLVKYVNAYQAALFLVTQDKKPQLRLAGTFAYEVSCADEYILDPEQAGLLGQSFKNNQYCYLTDLPENFVAISSGLGHKSPLSLLILPLVVNDQIEGMLEIAFFRTLEDHELTFLLRVGSNLGAILQTNRLTSRTNQLLSQTMNQAEELKAQEEELRQNLEEMEAINEEAARRVQEYEQQIDQLKTQLVSIKMTK